MHHRSVAAVILSILVAASRGTCAQQPLQIAVLRAQPSVLQAIAAFDFTFARRGQIRLRSGAGGLSLLDEEYRAAQDTLPAGSTQLQFRWRCIARAPGRYLEITGPLASFKVVDQPFSLGTAFVVDAAGTLLTNQHVLATEMVPEDPAQLASFLEEDVQNFVRAVIELAGGQPPDSELPVLDRSLIAWLLTNYERTGVQRNEVRIATHLQPVAKPLRLLSIKPAPALPDWKQSTVPCEVLVTGKVYPGKDVAVLRASSLASRLISLPLGDSSRFPLGSNIYALGFPGAAVVPGVDAQAARFRVIAHDGIVDQRLPLQTGWEAFHMTANINHGDSGGPVIDEKGNVIAINVAGSQTAVAQNLAIPINLAKEFLAQAKVITIGRNEVTKTWYEACAALQAGRYADALPLFENVEKLQGGSALAGNLPGNLAGNLPGNLAGNKGGSQASEMIELCRQESGASGKRIGIGIGVGVGTGKPSPAGTSPATDWWSTAWRVVRDLSLPQQILIGVLLLGVLGGALKLVRAILGKS